MSGEGGRDRAGFAGMALGCSVLEAKSRSRPVGRMWLVVARRGQQSECLLGGGLECLVAFH